MKEKRRMDVSSESAISALNRFVIDKYILNRNTSLNKRKILRPLSQKSQERRKRSLSDPELRRCVWIQYDEVVEFAERLVNDVINEAEGK